VAAANSLYNALANTWVSNFGAFVAASVTFLSVSVRDMSLLTNAAFLSTQVANPGTSASPAMPPQTALVMSGKTASRGKGFNARLYMPGWATNADSGGGVAAPALVTAAAAFGTSLLSNYDSNNLTLCVAHPARQAYTGVTGTNHNARAADMVNVVSLTLKDNIFDTVRSRVKP
jgi:hypothetical protein